MDCARQASTSIRKYESENGIAGKGNKGRMVWLFPDRFVRSDFAITDVDDAVGVLRDVVFVGDKDDGIALPMQRLEKRHNFIARAGIEVTGGFIGKHDGR